MILADLLAGLETEDLERLSHEHVGSEEHGSRAHLLETITGVLRSYRFLSEFFLNRKPPTFAMITLLLDAPDYAVQTNGFREAALAETARLSEALDSKEILAREDQLRVYRRVLYQSRSNDDRIDASEAAILSVLRQELHIGLVEHYLLEHHIDLREFWQSERAFVTELHALRSAGLVFAHDGKTLLAEDLVPVIRQVLGIDMSRSAARRIYQLLTIPELHEALSAAGAATSGSKDEKIDRLIANMVQPKFVLRLRVISLERLRDICRDIGVIISGTKDELIDRIAAHVGANRDLLKEPEPPPPPQEERDLDEARFAMLFSSLRGHELATILDEFELRRSGTKDVQVKALWDAHRAERNLLAVLSSSDLESVLRRLEMRPTGTKAERVQRLIEHFRQAPLESAAPASPPTEGT